MNRLLIGTTAFCLALNAALVVAETDGQAPITRTPRWAEVPDTMRVIPGERVRFLAPSVVVGLQYATFKGVEANDLIVDPHVASLRRWAIPLKDLERLDARR